MTSLFGRETLTLAAGQAVSGTAHSPRTLRVLAGRVWLTVEGAPDDHWLTAGESIAVAPGRLVVLEADRASRIALSPAMTDSTALFNQGRKPCRAF
jgi:quercetin dioxygenase-like cupin family protein